VGSDLHVVRLPWFGDEHSFAVFQLSGWCPSSMHAPTKAKMRPGAQSHMTFTISAHFVAAWGTRIPRL